MKPTIQTVNSALTISFLDENIVHKKVELVGILEIICQKLDLPESVFTEAEGRYKSVGAWLARSEHPFLSNAIIYPQGSMALRTVVRPLGREEFDIDLVCHCPDVPDNYLPSAIKNAVGDRLKEHGTYRRLLDGEKPRCWRLSYTSEFHMDITPSIANPLNQLNGELVPDRSLGEWKDSNPRGYKKWFEEKALIAPFIIPFSDSPRFKAEVEALPEQGQFKDFLRRSVQLLKRHRDVSFNNGRIKDLAPISILVTTLVAKSYEQCASSGKMYNNEFDLLIDVIKGMPQFIECEWADEKYEYFVWNETTYNKENFAEKWNDDPRLAKAFYGWQQEASNYFSKLTDLCGMDAAQETLKNSLGDDTVGRAFNSMTRNINKKRLAGTAGIVSEVGLTTGSSASTSLRKNTFFGCR